MLHVNQFVFRNPVYYSSNHLDIYRYILHILTYLSTKNDITHIRHPPILAIISHNHTMSHDEEHSDDSDYIILDTGTLVDKYEITGRLGRGAFSQIFHAQNIRTNDHVVIKTEPTKSDIGMLKHEASIYMRLRNVVGMLLLKWYGVVDGHRCLVLPYGGKSLDKIGNVPLSTAANIFKQCITAIAAIHRMGVVHRDIKPANILMDESGICRLVDFGLSTMYIGLYGGHVENRTGRQIIGSPTYVSVNVHNGNTPSRRDDLESLCYVYAFIIHNRLPWSGCVTNMILNIKRRIHEYDIFGGAEGTAILEYVKNLRFDEEPEYATLIELLIKQI